MGKKQKTLKPSSN
jgi:U3 small nucleolar RNA-associated protein 14